MGSSAADERQKDRRIRRRQWSVRHTRFLEALYAVAQPVLRLLTPIWRTVGKQRVEKPLLLVEDGIKALLFDCQTCGQCVLSETGMSCPMNCPKSLRNGPCGGVREDGMCELDSQMPCVWVQGWQGSQRMKGGYAFFERLRPLDHRLMGHSSWLTMGNGRSQIVDHEP